MSKLFYILSFVLLLSLHACNARHLSLTSDKRNSRRSHTTVKNPHGSKLPSSAFILKHSEPKVFQAQEVHTASAKELTETVMGKDLGLTISKTDDKKVKEVEISHLKEATQLKRWRRQARSTVESSQNKARETADTKENEIVDDVVAMDYAQPHRKPPIHNKKL